MAMNESKRPSETELMDFAKQKLLDGPTELAEGNRPGGGLRERVPMAGVAGPAIILGTWHLPA